MCRLLPLALTLFLLAPPALAEQPRDDEPAEVARREAGPPTPVLSEDSPEDAKGSRKAMFDKVLIQLNWGDDNLLIGAGETRESSPQPNFSRCSRTQIDGVPHQDCSEGSSRLGLYKGVDLDDGFTASGALVLGLGVDTDPESSQAGNVNLFDLGSYVRVGKAFGPSDRDELYVELYPVDARPLTLGFHSDIEWGTKDEFPRNFRRGLAPGLKLGLDLGDFYVFAGAKSALIKSPLEVELESTIGNRILFSTRTFYGVLGGLGWAADQGPAIEANGGFFHKGTLTKEGVLGKDILSGGGSLRLSWREGLPIGLRIDSNLYQRTAVGAQVVEEQEYDSGVAWQTALEGTARVQTLSDYDNPGSTDLEWAYAGHLGFKVRSGRTRFHAEGRLRSLSYITAEVPGFFPYTTLPNTAETSPEIQGLLSVDHHLGDVTLALTGGLRLPATYDGASPEGTGEDPGTAGIRTVVVSEADAGGWFILPSGDDAVAVWWAELGFKWHPAREFAVLGEVLYGRDNNRTQVERNELGHALRVYTEPNVVAVNLMGQFLF
ncbi:MAG: hypothetical protein ACQEXJ_06190 [Myxococcota bacterium]